MILSHFTITVIEADVRYIKCYAPSNDTHIVQERLVVRRVYDYQVLRDLFDTCKCMHERAELRCRVRGRGAPEEVRVQSL